MKSIAAGTGVIKNARRFIKFKVFDFNLIIERHFYKLFYNLN